MKNQPTTEATTETAGRKRRRWPLIVGAAIVVLFGAAAIGGGSDDEAPATVPAAAAAEDQAPAAPAPDQEPEHTAPVDTLDPLTTNGTWLVGSEIQPGTYRVTPAEGMFAMPYWARCADFTCSMSGSGGVAGAILENSTVTGPSFITIAESDVAVELQDVILTPTQ